MKKTTSKNKPIPIKEWLKKTGLISKVLQDRGWFIDMCFCENSKCPRRYNCARYMAIPHETWCSRSHFTGGKFCEYFIPAEEYDCYTEKQMKKNEKLNK